MPFPLRARAFGGNERQWACTCRRSCDSAFRWMICSKKNEVEQRAEISVGSAQSQTHYGAFAWRGGGA